MVTIVDTEDRLQRLLPALDRMVDEGLIAVSDVEVIKYVNQGGTDSTERYVTPPPS